MDDRARVGIIGGSGLYELPGFVADQSRIIETPFGPTSGEIVVGRLNGVRVAFLSRHGPGHSLSPAEVPYAANIYAMKQIGVDQLLSVSAVGSLRIDYEPPSFCVPDNLIDRTLSRRRSFFGDGIVAHVSIADPFCSKFASNIADAARNASSLPVAQGGAYVCIEGPQFSTRAESELYRQWGASIIGMTAMPEARLAREAELCYACLAMVTDYDVWHSTDDVNVELVVANLQAMAADVAGIVSTLVSRQTFICEDGCGTALDSAVITSPDTISDEAWGRLGPIGARFRQSNQLQ